MFIFFSLALIGWIHHIQGLFQIPFLLSCLDIFFYIKPGSRVMWKGQIHYIGYRQNIKINALIYLSNVTHITNLQRQHLCVIRSLNGTGNMDNQKHRLCKTTYLQCSILSWWYGLFCCKILKSSSLGKFLAYQSFMINCFKNCQCTKLDYRHIFGRSRSLTLLLTTAKGRPQWPLLPVCL